MERPPIFKLLNDLLTLALRQDDYIDDVPQHIAFMITEYDKDEQLYHIDPPDKSHSGYQLWHVKPWRKTIDARIKQINKAREDRVAYDNLKSNLEMIRRKLREVTKLTDYEMLQDMAINLLRNNPDDMSMIGIMLIEPYYRGQYTVIPFRDRS